jgi:hypothetical protein
MKKSLLVTEDERQRILEMHVFNNKVNVINEQYKELENIFVKDFLKGLEKTDAKTFDELGVIISKRSDETLSGAFDRILTSAINGGRQEGIQVLKFCRTLSAVNDKFAEKFYKTQIKTIDKIKLKYPEKWENLVKTNFGEKVLEKYKKGMEGKVTPPKPSTPPIPPKEIPTKIEDSVKYTTSSGQVIILTQKDVDVIVDNITSQIEKNLNTKWNREMTSEKYQSTMKFLESINSGDLLDKKLLKNAEPTQEFYDIIHLSKLDPNLLPTESKNKMLDLILSKLSEDEKIAINSIWNAVQRNGQYITELPKILRIPLVGDSLNWGINKIKRNPKLSLLGGALGTGVIAKLFWGGAIISALLKLHNGGGATSDDFRENYEDDKESKKDKNPGGGQEIG